jgi:hypothetical protein
VRVAVAVGIVAIVAGAMLALLPFDDGDVRCSTPVTGARVTTERGVPAEVLVGSCDEAGAGRLLVAGGLVGLGLIVVLGGLSVGGGQQRRGRGGRVPGVGDVAGGQPRAQDESRQQAAGAQREEDRLTT